MVAQAAPHRHPVLSVVVAVAVTLHSATAPSVAVEAVEVTAAVTWVTVAGTLVSGGVVTLVTSAACGQLVTVT